MVCHPHPLFGGTLDNKVVYTVARAFQQCGAPADPLQLPRRGRERGQPTTTGRGETADALAVIAYGPRALAAALLWLGGFSFGGAVAFVAAAAAQPARLVLVAPGGHQDRRHARAAPRVPWLLVQGDADDVVPADCGAEAGRARIAPAPAVTLLPGRGHFFHGRINELREAVLKFMAPTRRTPGDRRRRVPLDCAGS